MTKVGYSNLSGFNLFFHVWEPVGKHTKLTDKQTGTETKKWTFIDVIKKGKLPRDILNKGAV